jgi:tripartite-type tricarboxylate transporter receptor subunit TctC
MRRAFSPSLRYNASLRSLLLGLMAAPIAAAQAAAPASNYPDRPIRLVVPLPPGGGTDILARALGQKLGQMFGQQIVVDNRPGASGIVGSSIVARAVPDGYTLIMVSSTYTMLPSIENNLPFDPRKDFAPITQLTSQPYVVGVHPGVPANSIREFIALAKAKPGQLNYSSGGNGSAPHIGTELLKSMARIEMTHVPYKGGAPAMLAVVSGEVAMGFGSLPSSMPLVRAGKLKALGVTCLKRTPAAPDLPTVSESGVPGFETINWYGVLAPAKTPPAIVSRLHGAIIAALQSRDIQERLAKDGTDIVASAPDVFAKYISDDIAKWINVVKTAGIQMQ